MQYFYLKLNGATLERLVICVLLIVTSLAVCNRQTAEEYLARGESFAKNGEWASAVIEFKNSLKQDPENALARAKLGLVYVEIANACLAITELNKAKVPKCGSDRSSHSDLT